METYFITVKSVVGKTMTRENAVVDTEVPFCFPVTVKNAKSEKEARRKVFQYVIKRPLSLKEMLSVDTVIIHAGDDSYVMTNECPEGKFVKNESMRGNHFRKIKE